MAFLRLPYDRSVHRPRLGGSTPSRPPTKVGSNLDRGRTRHRLPADAVGQQWRDARGMTDYVRQDSMSTSAGPVDRSRVRVRRGLIVAGAAGAALVVWAVVNLIGGTDIAVQSGGSVRHIGATSVAVTGVLGGLAGWGLLDLFERTMKRPHRAWTVIAAVIFVLSLAGPLGATSTRAKVGLMCMHLAVAAVLIPGLPRAGVRAPR